MLSPVADLAFPHDPGAPVAFLDYAVMPCVFALLGCAVTVLLWRAIAAQRFIGADDGPQTRAWFHWYAALRLGLVAALVVLAFALARAWTDGAADDVAGTLTLLAVIAAAAGAAVALRFVVPAGLRAAKR